MAGLPPLPITAPVANPLPAGLYSAATVIDAADDRHHGGLLLDSPNIGGQSGLWPTSCPTPAETPEKGGERPGPVMGPATVVWAADECSTVGGDDQEALARAAQILRLREQIEVEHWLLDQLMDVAEVQQSNDLLDALEQFEVTAGVIHAAPSVIHANRGVLVELAARYPGLVRREGQGFLTPGGHRWAFGGGYADAGDDLVLTGPVTIRRGPVEARVVVDPTTNRRLAVAERTIAAAWEGPVIATNPSAPAPAP